MNLDLHVPRFTWPGGPAAMGPTLTTLAQSAESLGVRTLSVMDHWFQMEAMWASRRTDAGGLYDSRLRGRRYRTTPGPRTGGRGHVPTPGTSRQDRHHSRRPSREVGRARSRGGLVRTRTPGPRAYPFPPLSERFERLEETLQICLQMWSDDNGPYVGTYYQLGGDVVARPNRSARPGREYSSEGAARRRRCASWRSTPTRATSLATWRPSPSSSTYCDGTVSRSIEISPTSKSRHWSTPMN